MKLLILGAGGHGRVVKETAGLMKDKANNPLFDEISFLDDNSPEAIGRLDEYESFCGEYRFAFAAFGSNTFRLEWMDKLEKSRLFRTDSYSSYGCCKSKRCNRQRYSC